MSDLSYFKSNAIQQTNYNDIVSSSNQTHVLKVQGNGNLSQIKQIEYYLNQAVAKHKEGQTQAAINFYLKSLELEKSLPDWVYENIIILLAQSGRVAQALDLKEQALNIHKNSDKIFRAIGLTFNQQENYASSIDYYSKSLEINPNQPDWLYSSLIEILVASNQIKRAVKIGKLGIEYHPNSAWINYHLGEAFYALEKWEEALSCYYKIPQAQSDFSHIQDKINFSEKQKIIKHNSCIDMNSEFSFLVSETRETPEDIENHIDIDIDSERRQLIDSAIVNKYEILLENILYKDKEGIREMDYQMLLHCLAEIKTDIYYLKTKLLPSSLSKIDPQVKNNIDLDKLIPFPKPINIKCQLNERIVGSGWHEAEINGRWTGPGILSSVILPYPIAGKYKFELIIKSEAKFGILNTLKILVNDQPLDISIITNKEEYSFPVVVQSEIVISPEQEQPFLAIDLTINETAQTNQKDSRLLGLYVEQINLIPNFAKAN